jgi:hypothetical protein
MKQVSYRVTRPKMKFAANLSQNGKDGDAMVTSSNPGQHQQGQTMALAIGF